MRIYKFNPNLNNNTGFKGHQKSIDKQGYTEHKFYYLYDKKKYDCAVEIYNIKRDDKGGFQVDTTEPADTKEMENGFVSVDTGNIENLYSDEGFAYRFKLTDKNNAKNVKYAFDNGMTIGLKKDEGNQYNLILNNRTSINKNGPMQLIMPDGYYPGVEKNNETGTKINNALRGQALAYVRNHATKAGGNFYGIIHRLGELEKEGVKRIVGTPFTKDTTSSHKYWTENAFRVSPDLGSEEDFKVFQQELFKHGINWVADAALVNEGVQGVRISEVLRKGENSINKNMFRTDEKIKLGLLPDNSPSTRLKTINSPIEIKDGNVTENKNYNPYKPTYVQLYDERLASKEQKTSDELISEYAKKNTDNIYDITKHDDAVYPYFIEVSPSELERNIKHVKETVGEVDIANIETIKELCNFSTFSIVGKSENAGLEVWDGNVDIAKLNFYINAKDISKFQKLPKEECEKAVADFERGALAVRDTAINSGKYWTQKVNDIQIEYITDLLKGQNLTTADEYANFIKTAQTTGKLPKFIHETDTEVINNVLENNYYSVKTDDFEDYSVSDYILNKSMDLPLETLPVATNLLGIITSPYIAKKANTEDELAVSRYDLYKAENPNLPEKYTKVYNKTEKMYEKLSEKIEQITAGIHDIKDEEENVTTFGKYVLSEITPDLTKYLLVKALNPNANIEVTAKGIDFSNVKEEEITMQSLGIPFNGMTSEEEANVVINKITDGLDKISVDNLKENIKNRYAGKTENDYKIAEMITDRTESGLGWRIDASKDIEAIDSVRANNADIEKTWNNVIDFWKRYNSEVSKINPHAYTTAEITDLGDLARYDNKKNKVEKDAEYERKFLNETGITSIANYNYFFSLIPDLYANSNFEKGGNLINLKWDDEKKKNVPELDNGELYKKLIVGWGNEDGKDGNPGFLFQSPDDGVVNSYTFIGNHDKPRVLHCLGLDMGLYQNDLVSDTNAGRLEWNRGVAKWVLEDDKITDFSKLNSRAIAMGARLKEVFEQLNKKSGLISDNLRDKAYKAIKDLSTGNFKGKEFDAEAFGTRPFEIAVKSVFEQIKYNKKNDFKIENEAKIQAEILKEILTPAFDRFYSMHKLLTVLPGSPTDFAGDRVGATGYEAKAKNYHQQNRNVINWEWLKDGDDNRYKFVKDFYDKMNEISNLRSDPKLSALNDGATVVLPITGEKANEVQAFLRYNDKGSAVLVMNIRNLPDEVNFRTKINENPNVRPWKLGNKRQINISSENLKEGLKCGLTEGTVFKNANEKDNSEYKVVKDNGKYVLKRYSSQNGAEIPIEITPDDLNTLILYKK